MTKTPEEVLATASQLVRSVIVETLKYEREFQHYRNISPTNEAEICKRIVSFVEKEVR